jgi:hypothetical protein
MDQLRHWLVIGPIRDEMARKKWLRLRGGTEYSG